GPARSPFSRPGGLGWSVCGFLFGPVGLLLMLALQEWPARVACPGCGKPRVVTRDTCEHCGAPHAPPAPDGTEVFEEAAATPQAALAGRCRRHPHQPGAASPSLIRDQRGQRLG